MIKGLNIKAKFMSESVNVNAYKIECKECGHNGFVSPAKGKVPTCPKCSGQNGISIDEVSKATIGINGHSDTEHNMMLNDGTELELIHSARMGQQMGRLNTTGVGIIDCVYKVFTAQEKPPVTKEEFKAQQEEKAKSAAKLGQVGVTKRTGTGKKKSAISDADLDYIFQAIKDNFDGKFQNKDLAPLVADKFSARQTPSRLKRLVDAGKLESDASSPKNYWLV